MSAELILDQLVVRLGGKIALDSLSASIGAGTLCCLLGANGAGKTTLLRAITGYLPLAAGQVRLGQTDLAALSSRERARRVALVPQLAPHVGPLTVFEVAALGRLPAARSLGGISGEDRSFIMETLELLQLGQLADRRCDELSGGEWRKVLVAQGIIQRADVLLMDEPTAFLDPPARRTILAAARRLCDGSGTTVIAVLHDPQFAVEFADSALLLKGGRAVFHGPPIEAATSDRLDALYANGAVTTTPGAMK